MTSTIPLDRYCPACGAAHQLAEDERCFACGSALDHAVVPAARGERLAPGNLLHGRYVIVTQVGTGGYGAVYRAKDTQAHDRPVAIKAINVRDLQPAEAIDATDTFNREVSLLSGLSHPNLPHVYDHFTDEAHWFLVMGFIEGETLEEYVRHTTRSGQLPLAEVLEIGIQLCIVLDYLHTRQPPIIFRDVKPANVMRTARGQLYLIDFGIARRHKPGQPRDTIALGSPGYAAPEQYGRAQTAGQADIYSLGVTLHQLLTGHDPAETPFHLPPLDSLAPHQPGELVELIERMIDLDASKRPGSMAEVKDALRAIAFKQVRGLAPLPPSSDGTVYYVPPGATMPKGAKLVAAGKPSLARRIMQRTAIAMTLIVIAGGSLFGLYSFIFSTSYEQRCSCGPTTLPPQVLRIPVITSVGSISLDPALANDPQSDAIVSLVFSGLVSQSRNTISPRLATWEVSPDELFWTFTLQSDLRFNDGSPITTGDVAFSLNRALLPATHSPNALATLGMIKDADKLSRGQISSLIGDSLLPINATTLLIKLSHPAPYFLSALAAPVASVVEQALLMNDGEQYFNDAINGTSGQFAVEEEFPSQYLQLIPNAFYVGNHPRLSSLTLILYHTTQDSYNAYLDASAHYEFNSLTQVDFTPVPAGQFMQAKASSVGELALVPQPVLYYYGMNYLEKPFDNVHIRRAFALALDKNLIADIAWQGTRLPTNSLLPNEVSGYSQNITGPDGLFSVFGDFSEALQLLRLGMAEEGWSSVAQIPPVTFTYASDSSEQKQEIELAMQMWQQTLGITVKARPVSDAILSREIRATVNNPHGLQLWAASWQGAFPDPQQWLSLPFGKNSPLNAVNYGQNTSSDASEQQHVQQTLASADMMQGQAQPFDKISNDELTRLQQYQKIEQQLINDVAWIPMFQGAIPYLFHPYVQNYDPNSEQSLLANLSYVAIER